MQRAKFFTYPGVELTADQREDNARREAQEQEALRETEKKKELPVGATVVARFPFRDGRELVFLSSGHMLYRSVASSSAFKMWESFRAFHGELYADPIDRFSQSRNPWEREQLSLLLPEEQDLLSFFKTKVKPFLDDPSAE